MHLRLARQSSPVGEVLLVTDDDSALRSLDFADFESRMHRLLRLHYGTFTLTECAAPAMVTQRLSDYYDGDLHAIESIRVATGGTAFQREVWGALRRIAAGTSMNYGQLAAGLGRPAASRAVGSANGANPVAIVVPCHRVVGANGALTGYAGGTRRKRWLLDHESRHATVASMAAAASAASRVGT